MAGSLLRLGASESAREWARSPRPFLAGEQDRRSSVGTGSVDCRVGRTPAAAAFRLLKMRWASKPAVSAEKHVKHDADDQDHPERHRVTELPVEFRHVDEVHPVDPGDQCSCHADRAPGGDLADEPVQFRRRSGLEQIEHLLEVLTLQVGGIREVLESVTQILEVAAETGDC